MIDEVSIYRVGECRQMLVMSKDHTCLFSCDKIEICDDGKGNTEMHMYSGITIVGIITVCGFKVRKDGMKETKNGIYTEITLA